MYDIVKPQVYLSRFFGEGEKIKRKKAKQIKKRKRKRKKYSMLCLTNVFYAKNNILHPRAYITATEALTDERYATLDFAVFVRSAFRELDRAIENTWLSNPKRLSTKDTIRFD